MPRHKKGSNDGPGVQEQQFIGGKPTTVHYNYNNYICMYVYI